MLSGLMTKALRVAVLLIGAWATAALAHPVVLLFPAVGTTTRVTLAGRVLKNAPHGSSTLSKNLRSLTTSTWEGAGVEVRLLGQQQRVTSGEAGTFERRKSFENVLAKDEVTQAVVPGMAEFYRCLRGSREAKPVFALVSGSPVQFTARIASFLQRHDFPVFGQYLAELGPSTLAGYKQPVIRKLLEAVPGPVLIGDSGEKDPEVYAQLRAEAPSRVKAIFIRDAGRSEDPSRFEGMTLFTQPVDAARAAAAQGLLDAACAQAMVGGGSK